MYTCLLSMFDYLGGWGLKNVHEEKYVKRPRIMMNFAIVYSSEIITSL